MRPESTRVWYRIAGAGEWRELTPVSNGSDNGSVPTIGRVPAGDLYRVDLSPITATSGPIDLRVEDASGNRTRWTQAPALVIAEGASRPRRRAVH